ncbi:hypothetical protein [Neorickettsia sennetsu]|nr:hypothetical protein [Neorickettsia sennetsu]
MWGRRLCTALLLSTAFLLFALLLSFTLCVCRFPLWHRREAFEVALPRSFFTEVSAELLGVNYPKMDGCYLSSKNLLGRDEDDGSPIWGDTVIVVDPNERILLDEKYDGPGIFAKMYKRFGILGCNPFRHYINKGDFSKYGVALSPLPFFSFTSLVFLLHSIPPRISFSHDPEESLRACKALKKQFLLIFGLAEYNNNANPCRATNMYIPFLHSIENFTPSEKKQYMYLFANAFNMAVMDFLKGTERSLSDILKIPDIRICCGDLATRDMLEEAFNHVFAYNYPSAENGLRSCIAR